MKCFRVLLSSFAFQVSPLQLGPGRAVVAGDGSVGVGGQRGGRGALSRNFLCGGQGPGRGEQGRAVQAGTDETPAETAWKQALETERKYDELFTILLQLCFNLLSFSVCDATERRRWWHACAPAPSPRSRRSSSCGSRSAGTGSGECENRGCRGSGHQVDAE